MKQQILSLFFVFPLFSYSQTNGQSLKNLFNEFHASVNHTLVTTKTFFGVGLGANHIFHSDRALGARIGLEADFYHFGYDGGSSPEHKYESRTNQHFNAVNISVPVDLQVNFGSSVRYLFEMGAQLGMNVYTGYKADASYYQYGAQPTTKYINSAISLGLLGGVNLGIGVRIPFNEAVSLLIKPSVGANVYFAKPDANDGLASHAYAKLTLGILLQN